MDQFEERSTSAGRTPLFRVRVSVVVTVLLVAAIIIDLLFPLSIKLAELFNLPENADNRGFVHMFDLDGEGNLPAWYSSLLWAAAAVLAVLNGARSRAHGTGSWHWVALAGLLLLLSLDESASLHESIGDVIAPLAPVTGGVFGWAWVFYGIALIVLALILFGKFLLTLPPRIFITLGIAGLVFVGGALGAEMYGAAIADGTVAFLPGLNWTRLVMIEEFAEMLGVIIAIGALLALLRGDEGTLVLAK